MAVTAAAVTAATSGTVAGTAATLAAFAANLVISAALSYATSALAAKQQTDQIGGQDVTVRGTIEPRRIVYGETVVSGPVTFVDSKGIEAGSDLKTDLYHVIKLASHPVDHIGDIWLDGKQTLEASILYDTTGQVTLPLYDPLGFYAWRQDGTQTTVHPELAAQFPTLFTANHIGYNTAYGITMFRYRKKNALAWEDGVPNNIKWSVRGKKVYDPRLDTTNGGAGAHRLNDDTTWEWSANPILCAADYMMDVRLGMGIPSTKIDWPTVIAHADYCDVQVPTPSGNQNRFECHGVVYCTGEHGQIIDGILGAANGALVYSTGKYYLRSEMYEAPTLSITPDDIISQVQLRTALPKDERYNQVKATFVDESAKYEAAETPAISDAAFLLRDNNEVLSETFELKYTNNTYQAQRIIKKRMELTDQQLSATFSLNGKGWIIQPGDRIDVTLPDLNWSNKVFRVSRWALSEDINGGIEVTVREDSSLAYADPLVGEYAVRNIAGDIDFGDPGIEPPTNLAAIAAPGGIEVTWTLPEDTFSYNNVCLYASPDSDFANAGVIFEGLTDSYFHRLVPGTTRYYWVSVKDNADVESNLEPNSATSTITATAIASGAGADGFSVSYIADTLHWNIDTSTNTPTPAAVTSNVAATFKQGTTVIGSRTAQFTLDPVTGFITGVDAGGTAGITTTFTNDGTGAVSVTFTHPTAGDTTVTVSSALNGQDGADGRPGKGPTSQILQYDDLSLIPPVLDGSYALSQSATNVNSTNVWATLTGVGNVGSIWLSPTDTNGVDNSSYLDTVKAGDTITWFDSTRRWIEFSVTAVAIDSGAYRFQGGYTEHDEFDSVNNLSFADNNPVEFHFSAGRNGSDAYSGQLSNENVTVAALADGTGYSLAGTGGQFDVFRGNTNVTASAALSIAGAATKNGLTISLSPAGAYTLTGANWTTQQEDFTLSAVVDGVTITKVYTITKTRDGTAGSGAGPSIIRRSQTDGTEATSGASSVSITSAGGPIRAHVTASGYGAWTGTPPNGATLRLFEDGVEIGILNVNLTNASEPIGEGGATLNFWSSTPSTLSIETFTTPGVGVHTYTTTWSASATNPFSTTFAGLVHIYLEET